MNLCLLKEFLWVFFIGAGVLALPAIVSLNASSILGIDVTGSAWLISLPRIIFENPALMYGALFLISSLLILFRMRRQKEADADKTVLSAFKIFIIWFLVLSGFLTTVIIVMAVITPSALIGLWFFFAFPFLVLGAFIALFISFRKNKKPAIIFTCLLLAPYISYKMYHGQYMSEFYRQLTHLQKGNPTPEDWHAFLEKYESSVFITKSIGAPLSIILQLESIPMETLMKYVDHPDSLIQWSVAKNPKLPLEIMRIYLKRDDYVRQNLARNKALPIEIIEALQNDESPRVRETLGKTQNELKNKEN